MATSTAGILSHAVSKHQSRTNTILAGKFDTHKRSIKINPMPEKDRFFSKFLLKRKNLPFLT